MTAQTYQMISHVGFLLAAVFLALSVLLWFRLGIRKIIGDLSGRTAKRSIEEMRKQNEASGKKNFRPTAMGRGMSADGMESEIAVRDIGNGAGQETMPLQETPELSGEQTKMLSGETERLTESVQAAAFVMIQDIVVIHTEERI